MTTPPRDISLLEMFEILDERAAYEEDKRIDANSGLPDHHRGETHARRRDVFKEIKSLLSKSATSALRNQ